MIKTSSILLAALSLTIPSLAADFNAEKYGKSQGYPLASNEFISERNEFVVAEYSGQRLEGGNHESSFDKELNWVRANSRPKVFESTTINWPWLRDPSSWVERYPILAIVVYKEGKIIFEEYQYDRHPNQKYNSWSMAKTLTALTVGAAVDDGKINIDDTADQYIPELKGFPLGSVTIRNYLKMMSGSSFKWDQKGDARSYYLNKFAPRHCKADYCGIDITDRWKEETQAFEQGTYWNYDDQNSDILSAVVGRVYNKPLSKVFEEKIWFKIGARHDAFWRSIRFNPVTSGSYYFYATPHDWINITTLWFDHNKIISEKWLAQMSDDSTPLHSNSISNWGKDVSPDRYGYQTWIREGKWIAMAGYRGQKLFIDQKSQTSMFVSSLEGAWSAEGIRWFEWLCDQPLSSLEKH